VIERKILFADDAAALSGKKVLMLARNPCDIAVSWYLQFTKRTKAYKRELISHELKDTIRREEISMWDFVIHSEVGLPGLIEYMNKWQRRLSQLEGSLTIRYEDLRRWPEATLKSAVSFIGHDFSDDEIAEAVAFASFDSLQALEKQNYFRNPGLRLRNPNDPDMLKVRRGKVGGYRDYFTPEQVTRLEALVRDRLSPAFEYHGDDGLPEQIARS